MNIRPPLRAMKNSLESDGGRIDNGRKHLWMNGCD
jgi:hypothetical protein